ncbi:DUF2520 domain-containing protein, partial [Legionella pneumophila]
MKIINFIGCGLVGKTLGRLIVKHRLGTIGGIINKSPKNSEFAVKFIGAGSSCMNLSQLPRADIYFITTPDDIIETVCNQLVEQKNFNSKSIVIHCSGALTTAVLQKAKAKGCIVISVHPIKHFADPINCIKTFEGTYCTFEGNKKAIPIIEYLFGTMGGILIPINKEQKPLYHAACVLAVNLVSLHYSAVECFRLSGLDNKTASNIVSLLMQETLLSLQKSQNYTNLLAGPFKRGDINVIKSHLLSLDKAPLLKSIYSALGQVAAKLSNHSATFKEL